MAEAIIVCTPAPDLCFYCTEWLHSTQEGGFAGPNDNRYCSPDCVEAMEVALARLNQTYICKGCGHVWGSADDANFCCSDEAMAARARMEGYGD